MPSIEEFVEGLRNLRSSDFTIPHIDRYLRDNPVTAESLRPYLLFEETHYTRNLVYRSDLFELMVICWEVGQASRIHNHQDQNCWMAVPIGRLLVRNYEVLHADPQTGSCRLREASLVVMDAENPSYVDPLLPVHAVINPAEQNARAASLHIYSLPYDRCLVYSLERNSYGEVPLFFDSEYGRPASPSREAGDSTGAREPRFNG